MISPQKSADGKVDSMGKSGRFWDQQGFGYGYWERFRDPYQENLDKGILKVNENPETDEERTVFWNNINDLLISGSSEFTEYISRVRNKNSALADMGGNKSTYLGMGIGKVSDSDYEGIMSGSNNYEGKIDIIEIPRGVSKEMPDDLTGDAQANLRSELGRLMWIARIARPGAIYDASAAARTFTTEEIADFQNESASIPNTAEGGNTQNEIKRDFEHMPG